MWMNAETYVISVVTVWRVWLPSARRRLKGNALAKRFKTKRQRTERRVCFKQGIVSQMVVTRLFLGLS
jgi:hypothetical protein